MNKQIPLQNITPAEGQYDDRVDLYAPHEKIYTRAFKGLFRSVRMAGGALLFLIFFGTVWLNHSGHQAVWWNLPERKFYIFGSTFWPQDFILLSGLLIIAAFGLFFITVYAGRIWCGYTCPQSVWTWLFMWCEKITEGDRNQRIRLDHAPVSANKLLRKSAKHSLWLAISLATALTFVGYFSPIRDLCSDLLSGQADGWVYFWISFFTLATYGNAGWLREQVCIYMCPYARFQSVMFDKNTLTVTYDPRRGEPRGARKRNADLRSQQLGDCIDCTLCVQVCPTGIDIRDGLQVECIGCAACIDVCNTVMDKMAYPRGLISYTTEQVLAGQTSSTLRPRLLGYALVLVLMIGLLTSAFLNRSLAGLDVSRDRMLFRENAEGRIENVYSLSVMNKDQVDHIYMLEAKGWPDLQWQGSRQIRVAAGDRLNVPVALSSALEKMPSTTHEVTFILRETDSNTQVEAMSRFIGPTTR